MIYRNLRMLYIRVNKTASTSIMVKLNQLAKGQPPNHGHHGGGHIPLWWYVEKHNPAYNTFVKVGSCRHPFSRAASILDYCAEAEGLDPHDFVRAFYRDGLAPGPASYGHWGAWCARPCFDFLSVDGKLDMDFIFRFEHLQEDAQAFFKRYFALPRQTVPHENRNERVERDPRKVFTQADLDIIWEASQADAALGYTADDTFT